MLFLCLKFIKLVIISKGLNQLSRHRVVIPIIVCAQNGPEYKDERSDTGYFRYNYKVPEPKRGIKNDMRSPVNKMGKNLIYLLEIKQRVIFYI